MSTTTTDTPAWALAGAAWEHAAADWAYLFEPYARDAIEEVFTIAAVGPGTRLLDVACGSGLAVARATRLGATPAGVDAARGLVEIARRRAPDADLRAGDMFALPWADATFDVATSFNGIWGGCQAAVDEMARVVRPGGLVAFTFWGRSDRMDLRDFFMALGRADHEVKDELIELAAINAPGVAEGMGAAAGLELLTRGTTQARFEWPDDRVAWRALRSPGVVLPALERLGESELRRRALAAVAAHRAPDGSYAMTNELVHVVFRRPT